VRKNGQGLKGKREMMEDGRVGKGGVGEGVEGDGEGKRKGMGRVREGYGQGKGRGRGQKGDVEGNDGDEDGE
jgi:hypothetical protein